MNQTTGKDRYHSNAYLLQHSEIVLHIELSSWYSLNKGTHMSNIRTGCLLWLLSWDRGKDCFLFHLSVMCFKIYPTSLFYQCLPFHFTGFYFANSNLQFSVRIFLSHIYLICVVLLFPLFPQLLFFHFVFYCLCLVELAVSFSSYSSAFKPFKITLVLHTYMNYLHNMSSMGEINY